MCTPEFPPHPTLPLYRIAWRREKGYQAPLYERFPGCRYGFIQLRWRRAVQPLYHLFCRRIYNLYDLAFSLLQFPIDQYLIVTH